MSRNPSDRGLPRARRDASAKPLRSDDQATPAERPSIYAAQGPSIFVPPLSTGDTNEMIAAAVLDCALRRELSSPPDDLMSAEIPSPYGRARLDESFDAIVIGSGMGGLTAAALLARHAGKRVLVLERHYEAGGYTHVFRRPGYEWDVGVHYVGEMQPGTMLRTLFDQVTDGAVAWEPMGEVVDRIVLGDEVFEYPAGRERVRAALVARFPAEERAIDAYLAAVAAVVAASYRFNTEKALPGPLAWAAGPYLRRKFVRWAGRSTREVLESLTRDQRLIGILTAQWGDYGLPPGRSSFAVHALVANHYLDGGYYPVGGASRIAEAALAVIGRAGGRALIRAEVAEVVLERGRAVGVKMALDGQVLRAPIVISAAGLSTTLARLLSSEAAARTGLVDVVQAIAPSVAHLGLYVGLKHTAEELGLPRANLWLFPDEHHDETFRRIEEGESAPFTFISFPSAKDPDFALRHPGRATIDLITFTAYDRFRVWESGAWRKRGEEYEALKARLSARLLETLYAAVPSVRGKVDLHELSTPLSTRHFTNYGGGEIYGLAHTPRRFIERRLRPRTRIPGLFLTGQDVLGCGVCGAMIGGALTASAILGRSLIGGV
jgi:all-trans-retinol 13,14-reductase